MIKSIGKLGNLPSSATLKLSTNDMQEANDMAERTLTNLNTLTKMVAIVSTDGIMTLLF
jgi:hypothetical protein